MALGVNAGVSQVAVQQHTVRKHVDDRRCWNIKDTNSRVSPTTHSTVFRARGVLQRVCRGGETAIWRLCFCFRHNVSVEWGSVQKVWVSLHFRVLDGVSVLYLLSLARAMTAPPEQSGLGTASPEVGRRCFGPS